MIETKDLLRKIKLARKYIQDQEYQEAYNTLYLPPEYESNLVEARVSEKFTEIVDREKFKEIAEFVELEINEKHSDYWSNIAMGNASARFLHAYKKYVSKFSR